MTNSSAPLTPPPGAKSTSETSAPPVSGALTPPDMVAALTRSEVPALDQRFNDRAPYHWSFEEINGKLHAYNSTSNERFEGTFADFNRMLKG